MDRPQDSSLVMPTLRWWNSLSFRLALVLNVTTLIVVGGFWTVDYRRERAIHLREHENSLKEEAKILLVARLRFTELSDFRSFVDSFCHQVDAAASPGHHILVLDREGRALARAYKHEDEDLEVEMASIKGGGKRHFMHQAEHYISIGVEGPAGEAIIVAQSLAPVERAIWVQGISRAMSMGILVLVIFAVTTIALLGWVSRPLAELVTGIRAMTGRDFSVRTRPSGSKELRYLAAGVNEMAGALEQVENHRRAEMSKARAIQRSLLPPNEQTIAGYELAAAFQPTDSVGGDLYDVIELEDGSTLIAVLDVSGHGVPAALYTALLRTCLRHHAATTSRLDQVAEAMNDELCSIVISGTFATCFLVRLLPGSGTVEYISAGHGPAIIVRADGTVGTPEKGGMLLGVQPGARYNLQQSLLNHTDRLYLFTDGIHEVFDENHTLFDRERLVDLLVETRELSPDEQLETVIQRVSAFQHTSKFDDDITLLCIRRKENGAT